LSNSDASPDTPRAAPASSKPSLMGDAVGASKIPKSGEKNTRMLIELDSPGAHRKPGAARTFTLWIGAAALVATAGAAWWSQQRPVAVAKPSVSGQVAAVPLVLPATKVAVSTPAAAHPASAVSAALEDTPSAARIETAATAVPAATTLALAAAATAVAPALAATSSAPQKPVASAAASPAKARPAKSAKTAKSVKTAKQQKLAKQQLAKAKKNQKGSAAPTRLAKTTPAAARGSEPTASSSGKDADTLLLSALLAHVSRDAQGAPAAPQAQQTIAQIVQRCEARGKDTVQTSECRRRICDGYWGKAQACPAHLAPKKD
jgi:hypothetical protein